MATTPNDGGEREPAPDETEFGHFRNLARKLVRVPKGEIDAERTKEDERKRDEEGR